MMGGANWGGAAFNPETGVLYIRAENRINVFKLEKTEPGLAEVDYLPDNMYQPEAVPHSHTSEGEDLPEWAGIYKWRRFQVLCHRQREWENPLWSRLGWRWLREPNDLPDPLGSSVRGHCDRPWIGYQTHCLRATSTLTDRPESQTVSLCSFVTILLDAG